MKTNTNPYGLSADEWARMERSEEISRLLDNVETDSFGRMTAWTGEALDYVNRKDESVALGAIVDELFSNRLGPEGLAYLCLESLRRLRLAGLKDDEHRRASMLVLAQMEAITKPFRNDPLFKEYRRTSLPRSNTSGKASRATRVAIELHSLLHALMTRPHCFVLDDIPEIARTEAEAKALEDAALEVCKFLNQNPIGPWCRFSSNDYAKAARPFFLAIYGTEYQTHTAFESYRTKTTGDATLKRSRPKLHTSRAALRDAIWKAIVQGFKSIAPTEPVPMVYQLGYKPTWIIPEAKPSNVVQHPGINECRDAHRAVRVPSAKRRIA